MAEKATKTLYHSELVKEGECVIDVLSNVTESNRNRGTYYIEVALNGKIRYLTPETKEIEELFGDTRGNDSRKGQRLTIQATGTGKQGNAELNIINADWTPEDEASAAKQPARQAPQGNRQPAKAQPARAAQPPRGNQAPAPAQQAAKAPPANSAPPVASPAPAKGNGTEKIGASAMLTRLANLEIFCQIAAFEAVKESFVRMSLKDPGLIVKPEQIMDQVKTTAGRFYITMDRAGYFNMMNKEHILTQAYLEQKKAEAAAAAEARAVNDSQRGNRNEYED